MSLCKFEYCTRQVFSHSYCQVHQRYRQDEKYLKAQERARQKKFAPPAKKVCRDINFGFKSEIDMFRHVWNERSHVCEYTGENLEKFYGTEWWPNCFMHILPKKNFGYFKMNPENIKIAYPLFHSVVDQGTREMREDYPGWNFEAWDADVQRMKEEYVKFKKENLLP